MIKINLLAEGKRPAAVRRSKKSREWGPTEISTALLAGAIGLSVLIVAGLWWSLRSELAAKRLEVQQAEEEYRELQDIIAEVEAYKARQDLMKHRIAVIEELKENQLGPVKVMDNISRALPELLWLQRLEMTANNIKLNGRAYNTNAVATFTDNLDQIPEFREEPDLRETKREGQFYSFALHLRYRLEPLAQETPQDQTAPGGRPAPAAAEAG